MPSDRLNIFRCISLIALPLAVLLALTGRSWSTSDDAKLVSQPNAVVKHAHHAEQSPEFLAITDGTTELGPEEMPAYWQLLKRVESNSYQKLDSEQTTSPDFRQLIAAPTEARGARVRLTLNVRRILAYDVAGSPLKSSQLYEVWGYCDDAPESLYVIVTPDLPASISVGESVCERASFCGYFFKLQGYLPAGAETRLSPLAAPLLVGHMLPVSAPQVAFAAGHDWWRLGIGTLLVVSLVSSIASRSQHSKGRSNVLNATDKGDATLFEEWLVEESDKGAFAGS